MKKQTIVLIGIFYVALIISPAYSLSMPRRPAHFQTNEDKQHYFDSLVEFERRLRENSEKLKVLADAAV